MRSAVLILAPLLAFSADWTEWRGPTRDGVAQGNAPQSWPDKLTQKWKIAAGEGHSSPIQAAGRIFIFGREGENEVVRAVDPASGKVAWQQSYAAPYKVNSAAASHGPGPKSTPVFNSGKLVTFGIGGILSCFDAATGPPLWRHDFKSQFKLTSPDFGVAMSPMVDNGAVIVHAGGDETGSIIAFDLNTGKPKWTWNGDGPAYASPVIATLGGKRHLVTQSHHHIVGLDGDTGQLLWKFPYRTNFEQNSVTPVVYNQTLILSGLDNGLMAVRVLNNDSRGWRTERVWDNQPASMYMSSPVLAGDLLIGFGHKNRGQFLAVDPRTGQTLWTSPPRQGENAAIVRQGNTLYLLRNDAELIIARVNPKSFEPLKQYTVADSPTWAHPVILDNGIVVKDKTSVALWTWK